MNRGEPPAVERRGEAGLRPRPGDIVFSCSSSSSSSSSSSTEVVVVVVVVV